MSIYFGCCNNRFVANDEGNYYRNKGECDFFEVIEKNGVFEIWGMKMHDLREYFYLGLEMARNDLSEEYPQPAIERIWPSSMYGAPQYAFVAGWCKAHHQLSASKLFLRNAKLLNRGN